MVVNREKALDDVKSNFLDRHEYAVAQRECVLDLRAVLTELKDATLSLLAPKPVRDMDEVIARVERALGAQ